MKRQLFYFTCKRCNTFTTEKLNTFLCCCFCYLATLDWVNGKMKQLKGDLNIVLSKHFTSISLLALHTILSFTIPTHKARQNTQPQLRVSPPPWWHRPLLLSFYKTRSQRRYKYLYYTSDLQFFVKSSVSFWMLSLVYISRKTNKIF